jgi:hypothetical protein
MLGRITQENFYTTALEPGIIGIKYYITIKFNGE